MKKKREGFHRIELYTSTKEEYYDLKRALDGVPVSVWFRQQIKKFLKEREGHDE